MGRCLQQTEQFRYCFLVFEAAGVALRYRPVGLSESTRSSRHFKYSLELSFMILSECFQKHSLCS